MPGISTFVELRTVTDRPIVAGGMRLISESQVVLVRLPFGGFGSFWERPTAVVVERGGRVIRRLPIVDLTRVAQVGVVLGTLLLTAVCLIASSRHQES